MNNIIYHSLYYECHITIEPVFDERLEKFKQLCSECGFRVAKLIMEKGPNRKDSFCTGRDKDVNKLSERMFSLLKMLKENNFNIYRYKLENCILDEHL